MAKITFIVHGKIAHREKLITSLEKVFCSRYEVNFSITQQPEEGIILAKNATISGSKFIIAAGGDGTLNEAANGIMQAKSQYPGIDDNVSIGLLPNGTGNDFARTIGASNNIQQLKNWVDEDRFKEIDLGLVEFKNPRGESASRYFINITDVGIGGVIARKLSLSSKWMGAILTYQSAIIRAFFTYKDQFIRAKADNFDFEGKVMNFIVANGKYFGGGLGVAPDARLDDDLFSIIIVGEISLLDYFKNLADIRKCKKVHHPQIQYFSAREIQLQSPGNQPIDMDGEFIGYTPMRITVIPKALRFLCAL